MSIIIFRQAAGQVAVVATGSGVSDAAVIALVVPAGVAFKRMDELPADVLTDEQLSGFADLSLSTPDGYGATP